MELTQYVTDATRTESRIDNITVDLTKLMLVANMFIHAGNLLDAIKKNQFYGKPIDTKVWNAHIKSLHDLSGSDDALLMPEQTDLRTSDLLPVDPRIFHGCVGVATEGTELIEALMKAVTGISNVDFVNIGEEIADAMWYCAVLTDSCDLDWNRLLEGNVAKLRARYPEKFKASQAVERDLVTERVILETHTSKLDHQS